MHPSPRENAQVALVENERKTSAIEKVIDFRKSIESPDPRFDEVDELIDDLTVVDPYEVHAPSRRSDKSLSEFLNLIDSLETGNDRKGQP